MLSKQKYAVLSLELHIFFARIMKEHALFLEAGFTPRDAAFAREADQYKRRFETLLAAAVESGRGVVRPETVYAGEYVTDFTLGAEQKTQNFTGIVIDLNITRAESRLFGVPIAVVTQQRYDAAARLNAEAAPLIEGIIGFKRRVLDAVNGCQMFTGNYPTLIEHTIREAEMYRLQLRDIENGVDIDDIRTMPTERFWDQIMMEHSEFIRGMLDPSHPDLIAAADKFAADFSSLFSRTDPNTAPDPAVMQETATETLALRDFKAAATQGIAECKIRSIILPLLSDHVLREANHYLRLLHQSMGAG